MKTSKLGTNMSSIVIPRCILKTAKIGTPFYFNLGRAMASHVNIIHFLEQHFYLKVSFLFLGPRVTHCRLMYEFLDVFKWLQCR